MNKQTNKTTNKKKTLPPQQQTKDSVIIKES